MVNIFWKANHAEKDIDWLYNCVKCYIGKTGYLSRRLSIILLLTNKLNKFSIKINFGH